MNGQWIGKYTGTTNGSIVVNIDDMGDHFAGIAYLIESDVKLPSSAVYFRTKGRSNQFEFTAALILPISPYTGIAYTQEEHLKYYSKDYPDVIMSTSASVKGNWDNNTLIMKWKTDTGVEGECILPKSKADQPSEYLPIVKDWNGYKEYIASKEGQRFLFRGQNGLWRLHTSFHRTGRADLVRFINKDIQTLHKHLSARTHHIFNLKDPDENGAFFNLVQHHGYPTPLLDWSFSPYGAAFFAYRGITNSKALEANEEAKVRIFVFDQKQWKNDFNQPKNLLIPGLYLSVSEFIAIENERMIPQQAVSTVTNIDDIETYIKSKENQGKQYLQVIDLPVKERVKVMQELSYMGITAASLFPGLDGTCEELKERFFDI